MVNYAIDTCTLQSYFKSLCKSHYIAYTQFKQLEDKQEEYVMNLYLQAEGKPRKESLVYKDEGYHKLIEEGVFWNNRLKQIKEEIRIVLEHAKDNSITVTSKEEIIALIGFFYRNKVKKYQIINTDAKVLNSFPTGEKMYEEFLQAYLLDVKNSDSDDEEIFTRPEMETIYKKYF